MSRAQELTDAHWNNYVGPLLTAAGVEEKVIALCAFMYKSSGIHFYKHCQEDAAEAARGALANDAAHKAPSLCDSEVLHPPLSPYCGTCCNSQCSSSGRDEVMAGCRGYIAPVRVGVAP